MRKVILALCAAAFSAGTASAQPPISAKASLDYIATYCFNLVAERKSDPHFGVFDSYPERGRACKYVFFDNRHRDYVNMRLEERGSMVIRFTNGLETEYERWTDHEADGLVDRMESREGYSIESIKNESKEQQIYHALIYEIAERLRKK